MFDLFRVFLEVRPVLRSIICTNTVIHTTIQLYCDVMLCIMMGNYHNTTTRHTCTGTHPYILPVLSLSVGMLAGDRPGFAHGLCQSQHFEH